jgi:hypothetical protein
MIKVFIIALLVLSCSSKTKVVDADTHTFKISGSKSLPLDSLTGFSSISLQYYEDSIDYLYISYQRFISAYNLNDGKLIKKIYLDSEGPNKIPNPGGIYINRPDSIFVHSNSTSKLFLINQYGKVLDKFEMRKSIDTEVETNIMVTTMNPVFRRDANLHFCLFSIPQKVVSDYSKIYTECSLNLNDRSVSFNYTKAEKYRTGQWGMGGMLDRYYHDYNPKLKSIVQSFGNDEYLYVIDSAENRQKYYAGSKYFKSISPPSRFKLLDPNQTAMYEATSGAYESIKYDQYRDVYYRFSFLPVENPDKHRSIFFGRITIIILNKHFQKIGEFMLPEGYHHIMSYVGREGLHIANRTKYNQNEDQLVFDVFEAVER